MDRIDSATDTADLRARAPDGPVTPAEPRSFGADIFARLERREARVAVVGLGYVGLPLAAAACRAGFPVLGFDVDASKISKLRLGQSPVGTVPNETVVAISAGGRFTPIADPEALKAADVVIICVPTPLDRHRNPDLSYIEGTGQMLVKVLRPGQLVVLESTTYPGTTDEVLRPILERGGLKAGEDFLLAYSPEREDPGNKDFGTSSIPRVVGADDDRSRRAAELLYGAIVAKVVPVSSTRAAEAVKLTENIFRLVNIGLVNELKHILGQMDIDIWEVIEGAKSKPFGFMPFYPGPGLGGHCIPIDPFYLTWKAREFDTPTRFIELAGEVNAAAPRRVVDALAEALSRRSRKSLAGAKVLLMGLAYKKNVDDMRESPSLTILHTLEARGAQVEFHDPHIPIIPMTREHPELAGREGVALNPETLAAFDAALICTDHDGVDYQALVDAIPVVADSRNVTKAVAHGRERVIRV
ncbi:MAG: nucleotide sugar dehydrogenase [Proteobacteria bacterium]|nr:nucleotide sugar dehydrogenase [Pseudomonadota bacterium]